MSDIDTTGYQIEVSNLSDETSDCDIRDLFSQNGFDDIRIKPPERYPGGKRTPGVKHVGLKEELVWSAMETLKEKRLHDKALILKRDWQYHVSMEGQPDEFQESKQPPQ